MSQPTEPQASSVAVAADATEERGARKTREGYVVSAKMAKTIVVEVEDRVQHPPLCQDDPPQQEARDP